MFVCCSVVPYRFSKPVRTPLSDFPCSFGKSVYRSTCIVIGGATGYYYTSTHRPVRPPNAGPTRDTGIPTPEPTHPARTHTYTPNSSYLRAHAPLGALSRTPRFCLTDSLHPDVPENQGPREPAENPPSALISNNAPLISSHPHENIGHCPDEGVKCAEREDLSSLTVMCGLN